MAGLPTWYMACSPLVSVTGPEKKTAMTIFRRLVVLLDDWAPQEGAFALAADWACRLRLPILGACLQEMKSGPKGQRETTAGEVEKICGDFCAQFNIPWEVARWKEPLAAELRRVIQPADLLVCGRGIPQGLKNALFGEAKSGSVPALLLCPEAYHPLTRILLMDEGGREHEELFGLTANLCRQFRAGLVVLTMARTEPEARLRQSRAREALKGSNLVTDFDFVVGPEVRGLAASVAGWRRCQLVVMEPLESPRWWRWWRAGSRSWCTDLVDGLAFLTMTGASALGIRDQGLGIRDQEIRITESISNP
jgi:hypothetical protein